MALSNTIYNTIRFAPEYVEEGRLMDGKSDLSILLTRCATVKDVEKALKEDYDFTQLNHIMNGHFLIADATGDYAVFEYWNDKLYVLRAEDRQEALWLIPHVVPFEYNSMENYYCNPEATATYMQDAWQYEFSAKQRVGRMMTYYEPVMSEFQALQCLQKGTYGIEYPGGLANYSAVYNPVELTVLFNVHNDMSAPSFELQEIRASVAVRQGWICQNIAPILSENPFSLMFSKEPLLILSSKKLEMSHP